MEKLKELKIFIAVGLIILLLGFVFGMLIPNNNLGYSPSRKSGTFTIKELAVNGLGSMTLTDSASSSASNILTLSHNSTGSTGGADGIGSCILFEMENEDGSGDSVSTSTARICSVFDDVASTSQETSLDFYQILDNGNSLTKVGKFAGGNFLLPYQLQVTGTSTMATSTGVWYTNSGTAGYTGSCASTTAITVENGLITACS